MADDATLIFFRAGRGDLDTAAAALAGRGMTVLRSSREYGEELSVGYRNGPVLRVAFSQQPHVQREAAEIAAGTRYQAELGQCNVRYEIMIDDLDQVLDEINTLIEVQLTLLACTSGFMLNTWGGGVVCPEANTG